MMKHQYLIFLLLLLNIACKVKEENIVGTYRAKESQFKIMRINPDHTFEYEYFDLMKCSAKPDSVDSYHYVAKGIWKMGKKELVLNSFENSFNDTDRVRKILKTPTKSKESNFSFKNSYGNLIPFGGIRNYIYHTNKIFGRDIDDAYFWNIDMAASKNDTLIFYLIYYKPFKFVVGDTVKSNYIITLEPCYKQEYFKNKKFTVKRNRIIDNNLKFKKGKSPETILRFN